MTLICDPHIFLIEVPTKLLHSEQTHHPITMAVQNKRHIHLQHQYKQQWHQFANICKSAWKRPGELICGPVPTLLLWGVDPLFLDSMLRTRSSPRVQNIIIINLFSCISDTNLCDTGVKTFDPNIFHFQVLSSLPIRCVKTSRGGEFHDAVLSAELPWYDNIAIIEHSGRYKAIFAEFK